MEQLISFSPEVEKRESEVEEEEEEEEVQETEDRKKDEAEEDAKVRSESQSPDNEDRDAEALIDVVPEKQIEESEQTAETDSPEPVSHSDAADSPQGIDTTDFGNVADTVLFPDVFTPLLDSSAQKSKRELGKRRSRSRPSRTHRVGLSDGSSPDWRTRDSTIETDESSRQRESDSEDEQPKAKICSPPPASHRVSVFPGLSPAALIAQIKKKTGGGAAGGRGREEPEEDVRREARGGHNEEAAAAAAAAPSPSQLSSSPRSTAHLAGAARVLPPIGSSDGGSASCPAWLKELKTKKRLSQYGSDS